MILDAYDTLSNDVTMPKLGLGTWFIPEDGAAEAVKQAVALGYRLFDTAQAYGNEAGVGQGVRECGLAREEIFVTTKVAAEHKTYEEAARSIDESLEKMGLDYLDMILIHSPQPWDKVNQSDNRYLEENRQVWCALEDALRAGKVRAIGLSNFLEADIENIWTAAEIKPMVNQVLCHIGNTPQGLLDFCKSRDIVVEAYAPVAHGVALENAEIGAMAEKYGVSIPQLCIRYDLQLGTIPLPKTANPEHLRLNAEVDFVISDEDMTVLKHITPLKDYGEFGRFPVFGGKK
ncbi:MAG: aldo/keto reductase [Eubacterium sp.]|nr:aldo/keto reductase [Eubacterium sp.]